MILYFLLGLAMGIGIIGFVLSCLALNILNKHRNEEHKENKDE